VIVRSGFAGDHAALCEELREFVKARLAKHKYPRVVEIVTDVPKNDRGKVDRKALRALEAAKRGTISR
jgi:acyl-coenzyme A synthetase/AMP-(fatty) acid ligase